MYANKKTLIELIKKNTTKINFKNLTISNIKNSKSTSISLSIQPDKFEDLNDLANVISNQFPSSSMTIVDNNLICCPHYDHMGVWLKEALDVYTKKRYA